MNEKVINVYYTDVNNLLTQQNYVYNNSSWSIIVYNVSLMLYTAESVNMDIWEWGKLHNSTQASYTYTDNI